MGFSKCLLLGTGNQAAKIAKDILNKSGTSMHIQNLVNQTTIQQCKTILNQTELLITADSGLMHLGVASECKRIISLFTHGIMPSYRLPEEFIKDSIQSSSDEINGIEYSQIIHRIFDKTYS
jgi:hypothetical protein